MSDRNPQPRNQTADSELRRRWLAFMRLWAARVARRLHSETEQSHPPERNRS